MKTIILCGGKGTRMREETEYRPKPLVEIGGKPILWHIMKIYAAHGFNEFIVALGYKGDMIKDYFFNYRMRAHDFTLDMANDKVTYYDNGGDNFVITFAETGAESLTGERIKRLRRYLKDEKEFMVTYGDGVADIAIPELLAFHRKQETIGTITGVQPYSKYGFVNMDEDKNLVMNFHEKPLMQDSYINSGFMVFTHKIFDYLGHGMLETETLAHLAGKNQLSIYKHKGFWKAMDTTKEAEELNRLWLADQPWKVWRV